MYLTVKDEGGRSRDIQRLKRAFEQSGEFAESSFFEDRQPMSGLGLEIVRMLSEEVNLEIGDNDLTSIRVIRKREDVPVKKKKGTNDQPQAESEKRV